jgi:hypothetical protein
MRKNKITRARFTTDDMTTSTLCSHYRLIWKKGNRSCGATKGETYMTNLTKAHVDKVMNGAFETMVVGHGHSEMFAPSKYLEAELIVYTVTIVKLS